MGHARLPTDMPQVGFGTYLMDDRQAEDSVREAIRAGYRHIDTAEAYDNEAGIGRAIRDVAKELDIDPTDVFVTTKVWPGNAAWGQPEKDYGATIAAFEASLSKLGHIDQYLIHAAFSKEHRVDQWRALVDLKQQGKVSVIGVSNWNQTHLKEVEAAGLPLPDTNEIELHPWSTKPDLVKFLRGKGIGIIAYSSLLPLSTWRKAEGQHDAKGQELLAAGAAEDSLIKAIASAHKVTEAQVLLRWGIQHGYVVLPRSTNPDRMRQNLELHGFSLSQNEMAALDNLDKGEGLAWGLHGGDPLLAE